MNKLIQFSSIGVFLIFILLLSTCKKDTLTKYDTAVDNIKIYDDDSIALPITVVGGNNCLLTAYSVASGNIKFNLTDNDGKLIWQKQFGLKSITSIIKENDGTFTIIYGVRFKNIDLQGNELKDEAFHSLYTNSTIFQAQLNKNNNYLVCGVYGTGNLGVNRAFAGEYTHDGDSVFFRNYIDTTTNGIALGNYTVITGAQQTDDGGYMFFGSSWGYLLMAANRMYYNIIKTNNTGAITWQKNNLLIDSQYIPPANLEPPFTDQFPFSTEVYGFHPQSYTHEILKTADGNFLLFLNLPDYLSSDQRARVYKIDPNGNLIDSTYINFGRYNRYMGGLACYLKVTNVLNSYSCGSGIVRNSDNTFSICMQNGFFGCKGLTTSYIGESRSYLVRLDQDLNILNSHYLQNYYSDCFTSNSKSSDGRTIYFGLISSFGNSYKPALIFSNDN